MTPRRFVIGFVGCALSLVAFGFVLFANAVMREPEVQNVQADAIVVLTGGQTRITEAARLLEDGRGQRLLISGVNQKIGRSSLMKISGLDEKIFTCCVDLGYAALNTVGNADETRRWADALGYDRLIVVTASYHMPRSLAELQRAMPNIELVPHPVAPDGLKRKVWWLDSSAMRLLASEYIKFLPAAFRLVVARGVSPWQGTVTASSGAQRKS
ncbi:YdcF family protein [Hyphomicrobium sp. LHD-15]|uniref:YdcF family protein n=1 Tax=Hyphomicrobium sp. LHD-15 TaxID=3072142 RepID=UPI00280CC934|nr:YdcF family protein [Hyphomicrobium sp. LHD-15]MDQ8698773.1 YdcF family protein [Hyphomicrobium sp. LHD-15]